MPLDCDAVNTTVSPTQADVPLFELMLTCWMPPSVLASA
jgi:hypothetical protein